VPRGRPDTCDSDTTAKLMRSRDREIATVLPFQVSSIRVRRLVVRRARAFGICSPDLGLPRIEDIGAFHIRDNNSERAAFDQRVNTRSVAVVPSRRGLAQRR
jgi:hypothetical protein